MVRHLLAAAVLAAVSGLAGAQAADSVQALAREGDGAYGARRYAQAAALYARAWEGDRQQHGLLYNAACSAALAGDKDGALRLLGMALDAGYLKADAAEKDADLASLRGDARFAAVIARMRDRQALERRLWESPALETPYAVNISDAEKIAGLGRYWSEIKYNFVFTDTLKRLDWDKVYLEYVPKVLATASTMEYFKVLMRMNALLRDGHTNVYPGLPQLDAEMAKPALKTALVEDRVLVLAVYDDTLRAQGVTPGVEIVAVEGEPVRTYAERELAPLAAASTPQDLDVRVYAQMLLTGPIASRPRVTFARADGARIDAAVPRVTYGEHRKLRGGKPFEFRMLPGGVAYVALNGFDTQQAADDYLAAFDEIAKSTAMIIDVRANGGGNSDVGYRVLATLTGQPFTTTKWSTREYRPAFRAWHKAQPPHVGDIGTVQPDPAHAYSKPVVVLTGPATYSAAEDFAVAFDTLRRGRIVGEATGGSTGQPLMFKLPGGGFARVCTKADTYPDGRAFVGVGVQPHVPVRPVVADLRAGKDTVLERALAVLRAQ